MKDEKLLEALRAPVSILNPFQVRRLVNTAQEAAKTIETLLIENAALTKDLSAYHTFANTETQEADIRGARIKHLESALDQIARSGLDLANTELSAIAADALRRPVR